MAAAASDVLITEDILTEIREEFLYCAICLERYSEPKILPCHHTFCKKCLVQLTEKQAQMLLICPTCSKPIKEPISNLQSNFFMNSLLDKVSSKVETVTPTVCDLCEENEVSFTCIECKEYLCKFCSKAHQRSKSTASHHVLPIDEYKTAKEKLFSLQPVEYCSDHKENQLKFYCDTCKTPICMECTIIDHRVPEHQHRYIKDAAQEYAEELKEMIERLKVKADEVETSKISAKTASEKLNTCFAEEEAKINTKTDEILADLRKKMDKTEVEKLRLIDELKMECSARVKHMEIKVDDLEMKLGNIVSTLSYLDTLMHHGSPGHIENIPQQLIKGDTANLVVTTRDYQRQKVVSSQVVEASVTKPDGSCEDIKVQDNNDGTHTVIVHGEIDGKYKVSVTIDNQPIPGTPTEFHVIKGLVNTIGKEGSEVGCYSLPRNIAIHKNGDIVTADKGHARLVVTDRYGGYKNTINIEQYNPRSVCIFNDKYLVTDFIKKQVVISDMNGKVIKVFSENMKNPAYIAVRSIDDMIFVSDWDLKPHQNTDKDGHWIRTYTSDGYHVKSFGGYGTNPGQFKGIYSMAFDNQGMLFVSDYGNNRIQVFNTDNKYMYSFNCQGQGDGQIYKPRGIATDKNGYVYVCNNNNKVQKFDRSGHFICRIDKDTDGLNVPHDIAVTDDMPYRVVVVDKNNKCLRIFAQ
ncbi:E3 ubiquitin-protein ligase TRIM45-like [Saccoglossus kowalevskii]|uniref:Tripartite motif-containing protein 2-like n=1 Tax=Saccoglossus kowalevskii TaxID=10224 RepID=A0ABM0H1J0_SACKO|nr:PREDICTED: tripartite motif-containing protein 2-like [Saccoglossus kowalevskii]